MPNLLAQAPETVARPHAAWPVQPLPPKSGSTIRDRPRERPCLALLAALHVWLVIYLRRFKLDSEDNLLARKHVTQTRILERIARTLIVLLTLRCTDDLRQRPSIWRRSVASDGAASLVVGLASKLHACDEILQHRLKRHHPADPHRRYAFHQRRVGQC